ncbi:MAG: hypothetical protein QG552_2375, partial [Thermodesulfobacteriota bacterium]|nr:hypothetical protein [Thermodesulfobacteriota bacterium]
DKERIQYPIQVTNPGASLLNTNPEWDPETKSNPEPLNL